MHKTCSSSIKCVCMCASPRNLSPFGKSLYISADFRGDKKKHAGMIMLEKSIIFLWTEFLESLIIQWIIPFQAFLAWFGESTPFSPIYFMDSVNINTICDFWSVLVMPTTALWLVTSGRSSGTFPPVYSPLTYTTKMYFFSSSLACCKVAIILLHITPLLAYLHKSIPLYLEKEGKIFLWEKLEKNRRRRRKLIFGGWESREH